MPRSSWSMRAMRESVSIDLCGGALANGGAQSSSFAVGRESAATAAVCEERRPVGERRDGGRIPRRVGLREGGVAACEGGRAGFEHDAWGKEWTRRTPDACMRWEEVGPALQPRLNGRRTSRMQCDVQVRVALEEEKYCVYIPFCGGYRVLRHVGALDQLADRSLCMREVPGSKPGCSIFRVLWLEATPPQRRCTSSGS